MSRSETRGKYPRQDCINCAACKRMEKPNPYTPKQKVYAGSARYYGKCKHCFFSRKGGYKGKVPPNDFNYKATFGS